MQGGRKLFGRLLLQSVEYGAASGSLSVFVMGPPSPPPRQAPPLRVVQAVSAPSRRRPERRCRRVTCAASASPACTWVVASWARTLRCLLPTFTYMFERYVASHVCVCTARRHRRPRRRRRPPRLRRPLPRLRRRRRPTLRHASSGWRPSRSTRMTRPSWRAQAQTSLAGVTVLQGGVSVIVGIFRHLLSCSTAI